MSTESAVARLDARLAAIRDRAEEMTASHADEDCAGPGPCTGHDALRLLAALGRALGAHALLDGGCIECDDRGVSTEQEPCELRAGITRDLLGETDDLRGRPATRS